LLFLVEAAEQRAGGLQKLQVGGMVAEWLPQGCQFEIDVAG
jgi:hypothetical protein